jgi:hypothetical protein
MTGDATKAGRPRDTRAVKEFHKCAPLPYKGNVSLDEVLDPDPGDLSAEAASVDVETVIVGRQKVHFVRHTGLRQGLVRQLRMRHREVPFQVRSPGHEAGSSFNPNVCHRSSGLPPYPAPPGSPRVR